MLRDAAALAESMTAAGWVCPGQVTFGKTRKCWRGVVQLVMRVQDAVDTAGEEAAAGMPGWWAAARSAETAVVGW